MAKTRLKSKFLTDRPAYKPGSYKNTLVWRWLQEVITSNDDVGLAVRTLRKRVDMPNQFPHMTYLQQYLRKAKLDERVVQRVYRCLWNMYAEYRDLTLHGTNERSWDNTGVHDMPEQPSGSSRFLSR